VALARPRAGRCGRGVAGAVGWSAQRWRERSGEAATASVRPGGLVSDCWLVPNRCQWDGLVIPVAEVGWYRHGRWRGRRAAKRGKRCRAARALWRWDLTARAVGRGAQGGMRRAPELVGASPAKRDGQGEGRDACEALPWGKGAGLVGAAMHAGKATPERQAGGERRPGMERRRLAHPERQARAAGVRDPTAMCRTGVGARVLGRRQTVAAPGCRG